MKVVSFVNVALLSCSFPIVVVILPLNRLPKSSTKIPVTVIPPPRVIPPSDKSPVTVTLSKEEEPKTPKVALV